MNSGFDTDRAKLSSAYTYTTEPRECFLGGTPWQYENPTLVQRRHLKVAVQTLLADLTCVP